MEAHLVSIIFEHLLMMILFYYNHIVGVLSLVSLLYDTDRLSATIRPELKINLTNEA